VLGKAPCLDTSTLHDKDIMKKIIAAALAVGLLGAGTANAAPTMEISGLPISGNQLRNDLKARGMTDDQVNTVYNVIGSVQVYDDHQNPVDEERENRARAKKFYTAPFFAPSTSGTAVGAEQFSDYAMRILDDVDHLMQSFNFESREYLRLKSQLTALEKRIADIDALLTNPNTPENVRASVTQLRPILVTEKNGVEAKLNALRTEGGDGLSQLGMALRRSIASDIVTEVSRLGISPTAAENAKLQSTNAQTMASGIADLRARAGNGQYGIRQIIVESGYTAEQRDALRVYLELRPDVRLFGLAVTKVYARAAAQTFVDDAQDREVRSSPMILRAINGGPLRGECGNTRSCNVVIEYTNSGARDARFAKGLGSSVTPVLMPVTFQADVRVAVPDFVGRFDCEFRTGWQARGRADVKDGAVIYDGDLTNGIKYETIDEGAEACEVTIQEGTRESAFFHQLMALNDHYIALHKERQISSKREKDQYRAHIEAELQRHVQQSQSDGRRNRGGWFGDVIGLVTGGSILRGIGGWLLGEARDFYWHTTKLDTSSIDNISIHQAFNIHNLTEIKRFSFDGFPLVCWTPESGSLEKVMKACPIGTIPPDATTEVEVGNDVCDPTDEFTECEEEVTIGDL
jgi:hypothetical protein